MTTRATRARTTTAAAKVTAATTKTNSRTLSSSVDKLAKEFETGLSLSGRAANVPGRAGSRGNLAAKGTKSGLLKPIRPVPVQTPPTRDVSPSTSPQDLKLSVNAASRALTELIQSGWKASHSPVRSPHSVTSVSKLADTTFGSLRRLRELQSGEQEFESAALSFVWKLITVDIYEPLPLALRDVQQSLIVLLPLSSVLPSGDLLVNLLYLPPPTRSLDEAEAILLSKYLQCALHLNTAVLCTQPDHQRLLFGSLLRDGSLLTWLHHLSALPPKTMELFTTRAYTALTKKLPPNLPSKDIFDFSFLALSFMHHNPSVQPANFWGQACRFGDGFCKNPVTDTSTVDECRNRVLDAYRGLIDQVQKEGRSELLHGPSFITFCEHMMVLARKSKDLAAMDFVSRYLGGLAASTSAPPSTEKTDSGHQELEVARSSVTLSQATAVLERLLSSSINEDANTEERILSATRICASISASNQARPVSTKVIRAMERLRRSAVELLDGKRSKRMTFTLPRAAQLCDLLQAFLAAAEKCLQNQQTSKDDAAELLAGALETTFTLARDVLNPSDPLTYNTAYELLERAVVIADSITPTTHHSNYIRCIAAAFWQLAGILGNSGKYAGAIRFFKQSAFFSTRALKMYEKQPAGGGEDARRAEKDAAAFATLKDQLYRRWEMIGVCYGRIGDRKAAYDAWVEGVKTFNYTDTFVQASRTVSKSVFTGSAHEALGAMVDRLTYAGACELFLGADVSLKSTLVGVGLDPACVLAIVERQIESLRTGQWKEGVHVVLRALLQDCILLCEALPPVRKLQVLAAQLEHCYQDDGAHLDPAHIVDEIEAVLERSIAAKDADSAQLRAQYRILSSLWTAFHVHHSSQQTDLPLMIQHFQAAIRVLQTLVVPGAQSTTKKVGVSGKSTAKKAPASRAAKSSVKTPKAPNRVLPAARNPASPSQAKTREIAKHDYQNVDSFFALLQTSIQLLGVLGLVGLRVQMLVLTRRLADSVWGSSSPSHVRMTTELAHEYMKLGHKDKANSLYGQVLAVIRGRDDTDELRTMLLLRQAQCLAAMGKVQKCSVVYAEAAALSERLAETDKASSIAGRIRHRVQALERTALASEVFAEIQLLRDNPVAAMNARQAALKLWNRAVDAMARLQPQPKQSKDEEESNPFDMSNLKKALAEGEIAKDPAKTRSSQRKTVLDGLEWRVAEGLLSNLFCLAEAYFARGSPREVEHFAQRAKDLAQGMDSSLMICRAMMHAGEAQLRMGKVDEGYQTLVGAANVLNDLAVTEAIVARKLQGHFNRLIEHDEDAQAMYKEALHMLDELEQAFANFEGQTASFRKSLTPAPRTSGVPDSFLPGLMASVLQEQIWLSRDGSSDDLNTLLNRLLGLHSTPELQAEGNALVGKLTLYDIQRRLEGDLVLGSLGDSTLAIPMGMSGDASSLALPSGDVIPGLIKSEALFWAAIEPVARRGRALSVRESALSLALIQAYLAYLGKRTEHAPLLVANLLDFATSITLEREMLEFIDYKFPESRSGNELSWPALTQIGSPEKQKKLPQRRGDLMFDDSDGEADQDILDDQALKDYWQATRARYHSTRCSTASLSVPKTDALPPNWRVVHISVNEDKSMMFVSKQQPHRQPLVFRVPLKGRREEDADEHLTFEDAVNELKDIIQSSDRGAKDAVAAKTADPEVKAAWWSERNALDVRMKELLENIEFCWLGAFKTILSPPSVIPPDVIASLRVRFDKVFKFVHGKKKATKRVRLDDDILECFAAVSPTCRDEELEDLIYFILDLYQLHGFVVAVEEVDVDEVAVFLRSALEEFAQKEKARVEAVQDAHTFLILDRNVQHIPWESVPVLRGQSVSRVPSMAFLLDRVELARQQRKTPRGEDTMVDRADVDPRKTFFVLNPNGDLVGTENRFAPWLKEMEEKAGWEGVVGMAPSEQQVLDALSRKDLFIYFGHGGAEQYVHSHKIRKLPRCAATMLWGCSSGALRELGEFDRVGTPNAYALAGCPTLVANLWDVTDRDIDKFTQSVFDKLHLGVDDVCARPGRGREERPGGVSVVHAVAASREVCKLKYLIGAAPVVFGIPFYL